MLKYAGKEAEIMKQKAPNLILSVIELIVGILLMVNPVGFTTGIIMAIGCILIIVGIIQIVQYFRCPPAESFLKKSLAVGILLLMIGVWCLARTDWFVNLFPLLTTLYGVVILVSGVFKLQGMVDMIRLHRTWTWNAVTAAVTLVIAALILANPFATTNALWFFIGITLIIQAIVDLLPVFLGGGSGKKDEPIVLDEEDFTVSD